MVIWTYDEKQMKYIYKKNLLVFKCFLFFKLIFVCTVSSFGLFFGIFYIHFLYRHWDHCRSTWYWCHWECLTNRSEWVSKSTPIIVLSVSARHFHKILLLHTCFSWDLSTWKCIQESLSTILCCFGRANYFIYI